MMGRVATRIVVVDDNLDFIETLATELELDGYDVATAGDAVHAEQAVDRFRPRFVVLDAHTPVLNGRVLAQRLRERYGSAMILIALTGADAHPGEALIGVPAVDYCLTMPLDMDRLHEVLARGAAAHAA